MEPSAQPDLLLFLDKDRCRGCTHCLRVCPTEAIRIRGGKAQAVGHRCVHCGRCLQVCPQKAWKGFSPSGDGEDFSCGRKAIAILDSAVFWQFGDWVSPEEVTLAFQEIGFRVVENMTASLAVYRNQVMGYLASPERSLPAIGSTCPAVVEFVRVKYPSLIENLVPTISPLEILMDQMGKDRKNISSVRGVYITPCLAQAEAISRLKGEKKIGVGYLPIEEVYNRVRAVLPRGKGKTDPPPISETLLGGMKWAAPGGESEALCVAPAFIAAGLERLARILEKIEAGLLEDVPYIEAWACADGCLGGPLTVQDPCVAKYHLSSWIGERKVEKGRKDQNIRDERIPLRPPWAARTGLRLDDDVKKAMEKLHRIDLLVKNLPGIDCGSCGCPTCLALAEDVVQGLAKETDCQFIRRQRRRKGPPF